jgi:hypothetical protein
MKNLKTLVLLVFALTLLPLLLPAKAGSFAFLPSSNLTSSDELMTFTNFNGNAPIIAVPDLMVETGETINIPVRVTNFNSIGAVSLTLYYDPASLNYLFYNNDSGFPGLIVFSPGPGIIVVAGFNVIQDGFTIEDGSILFSLNFTCIGGNTALTWYDDGASCECAGPTPDYLPLNDSPTSLFYLNGSVNVSNQSLNGRVSYYSYASSGIPLEGFIVQLKNVFGSSLSTTTTNSDGYYEFSAIPAGAAWLQVSSPLEWGGANATDALAAQLHSIGHPLNFWYPEAFINSVADVNSSGAINASDALNIMQRSIQLTDSFDAGDWSFYSEGMVFENSGSNTAITSFNGQSQINIHALCFGDINGSCNFQATKSLLPIISNSKSEVDANVKTKLPVILLTEQEISAASVFIKYDTTRITVFDVKTENQGLMFNISNGWVKMVWKGPEPLKSSCDGGIATLVLKVSKEFKPGADLFSLGSDTEFADPDCNILSGVALTIPELVVSANTASPNHPEVLLSLNCFPNPCSKVLNIDYILQSPAAMEISISSFLGQKITIHQFVLQDKGQYHHQFNLKEYGLKEGFYLVNFFVKTKDNTTRKFERIIMVTE